MISATKKQRYQVFFLTLYSMGLRLSEGLNLTIHDIDSQTMQVHIREAKGGKDRLVPLPKRTLHALRCHWQTHHHARFIFPGLGNGMNSPMDKGGLDLRSLQVLLGHASLNTTARYTQLTQLKQRDAAVAINQLADKLALDWSLK
ncbi:tyrosine-type recombinase/integrase [Moritella sp.]|uniref:tyrosine-type recombinase/integrase n=1 Tax=Moritella sp. TaxID=78556 RepID=UPI0025FE5D28|nr:tyrosine-type recombinase/integrase [Moritella sp.]MCJ8348556.1 tyrosine-type recombinase/integrase [Moritella sp.]